MVWLKNDSSAGVRDFVWDACAPSVGNSPARVMRYCACAACTLSSATRRSRLFFNAISMSRCSLASTKKSRQPISAAATPFALRVPPLAARGCVA